jgi:hypothetical protein
MVASDQIGISVINPKTFLANKAKENKEDSKEKGLNLGIFNMLKEKKRDANEFQRIKNEAFGNTSSNNVGKTDTKVASSLSGGSSGGNYVDAGDRRGFVSTDQADRMLKNPEAYKMRPSETRYLRESMGLPRVDAKDNKIYSDTNTNTLGARDGSLIAMANTKVNETKREGSKFFSSAFNNESSSQTATDRTRMAGEGIFRSGISSEAFSPTVKPQYQINRERNRPNQNENAAEAGARTPFSSVNLNIARGVDTDTTTNKAEDTSFSSYVRGAKPGQERGNTRLAQARKVAKRNPNVSINKSTGRAEATNDSGKAKAQAAALNRQISGGGKRASGSERAKAAYRRNIKRGHKGTASASAANKASMRKRAKARHKASQAKRRARNKARRSRRRSRSRSRGRRCDLRFKFNIMPLTNMNLIRDDLAEVAYFVKELQA